MRAAQHLVRTGVLVDAERDRLVAEFGGTADQLARYTALLDSVLATATGFFDATLLAPVGFLAAEDYDGLFAPLPRSLNPAAPTTGYDDVKRVALARLFVANVPSIQVDWALYGPKLAQVALTFGADDVDAVSPLDETGEGHRRAPLEEIRRNIRAAGLEPVERDGLFEPRRR